MDIQLRRALLDVCTLATIKDEPSYGYKIIKDMSTFISISESNLYPILRRLESQNLLTVENVEHNGRLRKYYKITELGKVRLENFKEEWKEVIAVYNLITKGVVNYE